MNKPRIPTAESVMASASGGGISMDARTAERIAGAIAPALKAFDAPALVMPMAAEPAGWTQAARANGLANAARKKGGRS